MESRLEQAARHVLAGQEILRTQRRRLAMIQAMGGNAVEAERLLRQCERALALFEEDFERIRQEICSPLRHNR